MALIAIAADKGSPGVTTAAMALATAWPRPVLLAECDPAGGDLAYRMPAEGGGRLDTQRGLLSLAIAARRGLSPQQVWEHAQQLPGGLPVLTGVSTAEQGAGLDRLWRPVGVALSRVRDADVIADCGRIGVDGPLYDLLAEASFVVLVMRASLGEVVRLRERAAAVAACGQRRGQPGPTVGVIAIAGQRDFSGTVAELSRALNQGQGRGAVRLLGGLAYEPKSAAALSGERGGSLSKSLLIRSARDIAARVIEQLPAPEAVAEGGFAAASAGPGTAQANPGPVAGEFGAASPGRRMATGGFGPGPTVPGPVPAGFGAAPAGPVPAGPVPAETRPAETRPAASELLPRIPPEARPAPVRAESMRPEPMRPEPIHPEPLRAEPLRQEPLRPVPVRPEPPRPEPMRPGPAHPEPVRPEAARPEPARGASVWAPPVRGESAWTEPARVQPDRPQPVRPEPVRPEPPRAEPPRPEPPRGEPPRPEAPVSDPQGAEPPQRPVAQLRRTWPPPDEPNGGPAPYAPAGLAGPLRGRHHGASAPDDDDDQPGWSLTVPQELPPDRRG
ncbi:MAG TPA: hypothetical protein VK823_29900 [Streptosporangiaceae bacterium]|nr:hypothetical protein [Streptosporangiaceae bacterium]